MTRALGFGFIFGFSTALCIQLETLVVGDSATIVGLVFLSVFCAVLISEKLR